MSTISYANVVATGSTTPTSQADSIEINTDSINESLEKVQVSEETNSDEQVLPSPKASPQAEKVKKDVQLAPAPVPQVSAWGSTPSSRSNSNITVDAKSWPSPLEVPSQTSSNGSVAKKIVASKSSKEKWVPFKASVVLSTSSSSSPSSSKKQNTQKRNSTKNVSNNNSSVKPTDAKKRKNKTEKRTQSKDQHQKEQSEEQGQDSNEASTEDKPESKETTDSESQSTHQQTAQVQQSRQFNKPQSTTAQPVHDLSQPQEQQEQPQPQLHQQQFNIPFHPHQQQFYPQVPGQTFRPYRTYNNNSRRYNKYQNNQNGSVNGFVRHNSHHQQFTPFHQQSQQPHHHHHQRRHQYNINHANAKPIEPLFSLIKQVEYYFSIDNLLKDFYLRKQMNDEGWLPLNVIANFNRMHILSTGDVSLIRKSIDELNGQVLEIAEFENDVLKVRAKENWKNWVLPAKQRDTAGNDESKFVKLVVRHAQTTQSEEVEVTVESTEVAADSNAKVEEEEEEIKEEN